MGEFGQQRRLAHPRFTTHHDAPHSRLPHQGQLGPEHLLLGVAADERRPMDQIGRQWNVQLPDGRRHPVVGVDTVPRGRHPAFDPDDLG